MPPEDVVHVLTGMLAALRPDGVLLDLQVIRPNPRIEADGRFVCEIDGEPLFEWADAASAAVDACVRAGELVDEATDDHDVRKHYVSGHELLEDFASSKRRIAAADVAVLRTIDGPCSMRERCRLRRLRAVA